MKLSPLLAPAILLIGLGASAGWFAAGLRGETKPPTSATPARPTTSENDVLDAPPNGFDSSFVKVAPVGREQVPDIVPIAGKLAFNAERLHLVSARVAGRLDSILVFEGAKVVKGQALAELYSPDWVSAQNEFLLARNTVRAFAEAKQSDLLEDARATEASARNRLRVVGAADEDIAQLEKTGVVTDHLALRAPISGTISQRNMDPGAFLNVGDNFMTVSDISQVWFVGNIYEQDYAKVKLGQKLVLNAPALPGQSFTGTVNFIGTNIDPTTHTLPIRCIVNNPDGSLRPELFVTAGLDIGKRDSVVIPRTALVADKQAQLVIIETQTGHYRRQAVSAAPLDDSRVAVVSGLEGGERIVIEGGTLLNEAMNAR